MLNDALAQTIIRLAQRCEGVSARDPSLDAPRTNIDRRLIALTKAGKLIKVALSPRNVRYYAHERDAALARQRIAHMSPAAPAGAVMHVAAPKDRPRNWADMEAVVTPRTKFTRCPSPPTRFEAVEVPVSLQRGRVITPKEYLYGTDRNCACGDGRRPAGNRDGREAPATARPGVAAPAGAVA